MKIDKKELKKVSREFRSMASRVLNSHYEDFYRNLRMFIIHIQQTDLLFQYIESLPDTQFDLDNDIPLVAKNFGRYLFDFGNTPSEQVVNVYKLLSSSAITEQNILDICSAYSPNSPKYQDIVKAFGQRVVLPFVNCLETYLTNIGIDMGMDESVQYMITVNGGQVNLAQDNSNINATQNNSGIDFNHLQELINAIDQVVKENTVPAESAKQICELLVGIKEEMQKPTPKKSVINMLLNGLKSTANVLASIPEISQKINSFAEYVAPFIS